MSTERAWFTIDEINDWADRYLARQKEKAMNTEDDEFNRIEREAAMRKAAVHATVTKKPWQGLTEQDLSAINQSCLTKLQAAISAEAILKEKNEM
jgi:hypothetical protein